MDFLRIVRSLEELLYEVMTWLLFYPRTLWRTIRHPGSIIAYAEKEMGEDFDERFNELISPLLFLMLSLLLAHALELALHARAAVVTSDLGKRIMDKDENLLLFRTVVFSLYPLVMSVGLLRRRRLAIDRLTLRRPFYLQCFFAGPYAIFISGSSVLLRLTSPHAQITGFVIAAAVTLWYVSVQTYWFHRSLRIGWLHALAIAVGLFFVASVLNALLGLLILTG